MAKGRQLPPSANHARPLASTPARTLAIRCLGAQRVEATAERGGLRLGRMGKHSARPQASCRQMRERELLGQ